MNIIWEIYTDSSSSKNLTHAKQTDCEGNSDDIDDLNIIIADLEN